MWNKLSLRLKFALIMFLSMAVVTIILTMLSFSIVQSNIEVGISVDANDDDSVFIMTTFMMTTDAIFSYNAENDITYQIINFDQFATDFQTGFSQDIYVAAIIFILVSSVIAYFLAGTATRPIRELANQVEKINPENLDSKIEMTKAKDEISQLTGSFNEMLAKLHHSFESKKLFAQNAAHELKTPLASMRANIEVLELDDEPAVDEYQATMTVIKSNTERLIKLVEGLLNLHELIDDSNKTVVALATVVNEISTQVEIKSEIDEKNIFVGLTGDKRIFVNEVLFKQAIANLIHNAVRYNKIGGKLDIVIYYYFITISNVRRVFLCETLVKVLDPFYCVDKSRSKELGGHGLGLAITKNIVHQHQMKLRIDSELNVGTTLTIAF